MVEWVAEHVPRTGTSEERLERLAALFRSPQLGLAYVPGHTGTAAEVWETRSYDCLSLAILFVALAREAGIDARWLEVEGRRTFGEDGTLVVVAGHVTAGWGPPAATRTVDLGFGEVVEGTRVNALGDDEVRALWDLNVGAERLRAGAVADALPAFEDAVARAPEL